LLASIKSLYLIGYCYDFEAEYRKTIFQAMPQALWKKKVYAFNIYKEINKAHVGLCLSAEEGAMFVSAEYLLCGIPVVSTRNKGGRDVMFTPEHVFIADDTPESVAHGGRCHDPWTPVADFRRCHNLKNAESSEIFIQIPKPFIMQKRSAEIP
jgi:hypothetical protein